ncbi:MAG: uroporphyrinogen-III synthase [Sphingomonas sp.]|uniref:uroporphyrinogen-III synthase n=1 Tax=Sphingomonas sp. TaxID=28214 RepID=UPI0025E1E59C|nr:uroporphyrinogen-III synthase [Sphingomonas sp.]MBX3565437.1 uroporphyrinogen-III synthase [Sphingomonas sp.]
MSRPIAVLRPEPGNRVTAAAIEAAGRGVIRMPLFATAPIAWDVPDPTAFDALILTSANAMRHGGPGLARLIGLPVHAVGTVTGEAARRFGFNVVTNGDSGAATLLARAEATGTRRALHLAGRERTIEAGGIVADVITVYASDPLPVNDMAMLSGSVALVQSARAAMRLREIAADRATIVLVTISSAVAEAAGDGWERVVVSPAPSSEAMIDAAMALAD